MFPAVYLSFFFFFFFCIIRWESDRAVTRVKLLADPIVR
jgi:hypothetical protein